MSRREGRCYIWKKKSDAVSLRTHQQLSCHKDNCLWGQHHTTLSASGHPPRQEEGAAEVGTPEQGARLLCLSFTLSASGAPLWESQMPGASIHVNGGRRLSLLCTTTIHLKCAAILQLRRHPESKACWHPQEGKRLHVPKGTLSINSYWVVLWDRLMLDLSRSSLHLSPWSWSRWFSFLKTISEEPPEG